MLSRLTTFLCFFALLSFLSLQAGALPEPNALQVRQNNGNSPPPPPPSSTGNAPASSQQTQPSQASTATAASSSDTSADSTSTAASTSDSPTPTSGNSTPASSQPQSSSSPSSTLATSTTSSSASTSSPAPTPTASPSSTDDSSQLPIQPVITPALGIAGVILIVAGGAVSFIGVRSKWLFIFASTAYLVALAIVVLLVYVANPPVSDAIQGAYFVAAFVPACIIGGVSLIFKDLVEGLGCLLGGFCLAMWFLVLKSGGLITSTGGRTGFIVGLAAAGFSLSFSHYTRAYGLIACLAFSGATSVLLGVDCFSRVGLKEFWLYNWNLNSNLFPLNTTTYPVTRGIKVEIACIIILAVFGAMSQMKLWKIIREKRQKRADARLQDQEDREHLEANLGRQLEERNNKELAQWEATYDSSKMTSTNVSGFTTTYHSSAPSVTKLWQSPKDSAKEIVEMTDFSGSVARSSRSVKRSSKEGPCINVTDESNIGLAETNGSTKTNPEASQALQSVSERSSVSANPNRMSYVVRGDQDEGRWEGKPQPSGPQMKPLPFSVPSGEAKSQHPDDDVQSVATAGSDVDQPKPSRSPRQSVLRTPNKRTSGTAADEEGGFDMPLAIPHHDDARSSLAATVDGLSDDGRSDLPALSRSGTPLPLKGDNPVAEEPYTLRKVHSASSLVMETPKNEHSTTNADADANRRHSVHLGELVPKSNLGSLSNLTTEKEASQKTSQQAPKPRRFSEDTVTVSARNGSPSSPSALTKDALPESQSSTVLLYRTNEWAKHQAVAEAFHPDEVAPPSEAGVSIAYGEESAAPVDMAALSQTAFHSQPASLSRESSHMSSNNPYRKQSGRKRRSADLSPGAHAATTAAVPAIARSSSQTSLVRSQMVRSPSNPVMSPKARLVSPGSPPIAESAVEDMAALQPTLSSQARASNTTLIGRRQSMLNGRMSSMSFASPDAPTHSMAGLSQIAEQPVGPEGSASVLGGADDNVSLSSRRRQLVTDENMTLAQRKEQLRQEQSQLQRSSSALQSQNPYRGFSPTSPPTIQRSVSQQYASPHNQLSASNQRLIYDSHQPQRGNTATAATRESRLANWRASVAQDASVTTHTNASQVSVIDDSRARIMEEQRRAGDARAQRELENRKRDSQIDMRMRSGDMVALHREKLRKLQRQASLTQ